VSIPCYVVSTGVYVSCKCGLSGGLMKEYTFTLQVTGVGKNLRRYTWYRLVQYGAKGKFISFCYNLYVTFVYCSSMFTPIFY
jgi:hypothetical protein